MPILSVKTQCQVVFDIVMYSEYMSFIRVQRIFNKISFLSIPKGIKKDSYYNILCKYGDTDDQLGDN